MLFIKVTKHIGKKSLRMSAPEWPPKSTPDEYSPERLVLIKHYLTMFLVLTDCMHS